MNNSCEQILSVIVPNYNNSKYLPKCIESVINQSYKNIEIIIVDDCSTDNSVEIIQKYRERDLRIKLITNLFNQGVSKTRDIGIQMANGQWITTLDSDDYYIDSLKLEKEMDLILESNTNEVIAYSGIIHVDEQGNEFISMMTENSIREGNVFEDMVTRNFAIPRDFIFSKEFYNRVGGYDYTIPLYEDWDLKIRLSKEGKFVYSGIDGIAYRRHGNGLSSAKHNEHKKWVRFIFDKYTKNLPNKYELENILKKNFNFYKPLDDMTKNRIVNGLINEIQNADFDNFSIWGTGELTDLLLIELFLKGVDKKVNFIIDSRADNMNLVYHGRKVVSPNFAVAQGEQNFILASWNNIHLLENLLEEIVDDSKSKKLLVIKPIAH